MTFANGYIIIEPRNELSRMMQVRRNKEFTSFSIASVVKLAPFLSLRNNSENSFWKELKIFQMLSHSFIGTDSNNSSIIRSGVVDEQSPFLQVNIAFWRSFL